MSKPKDNFDFYVQVNCCDNQKFDFTVSLYTKSKYKKRNSRIIIINTVYPKIFTVC